MINKHWCHDCGDKAVARYECSRCGTEFCAGCATEPVELICWCCGDETAGEDIGVGTWVEIDPCLLTALARGEIET